MKRRERFNCGLQTWHVSKTYVERLLISSILYIYRRMFPSMRVSISGLDNDQNYCVLLEMVPVADCRFKFSGSQWVPAGGAEPQSLQNIYIHPDSPALGSHWQAQPINFNKTKLTNNTLDSNGHVRSSQLIVSPSNPPLLSCNLKYLEQCRQLLCTWV